MSVPEEAYSTFSAPEEAYLVCPWRSLPCCPWRSIPCLSLKKPTVPCLSLKKPTMSVSDEAYLVCLWRSLSCLSLKKPTLSVPEGTISSGSTSASSTPSWEEQCHEINYYMYTCTVYCTNNKTFNGAFLLLHAVLPNFHWLPFCLHTILTLLLSTYKKPNLNNLTS